MLKFTRISFYNNPLNRFKTMNEKQSKKEIKMLLYSKGFYEPREFFSDCLIVFWYFFTYPIYLCNIWTNKILFYSTANNTNSARMSKRFEHLQVQKCQILEQSSELSDCNTTVVKFRGVSGNLSKIIEMFV